MRKLKRLMVDYCQDYYEHNQMEEDRQSGRRGTVLKDNVPGDTGGVLVLDQTLSSPYGKKSP